MLSPFDPLLACGVISRILSLPELPGSGYFGGIFERSETRLGEFDERILRARQPSRWMGALYSHGLIGWEIYIFGGARDEFTTRHSLALTLFLDHIGVVSHVITK